MTASTLSVAMQARGARRFICAIGIALVIAAFIAAHRFWVLDELGKTALNDIGWWLTCIAATIACWRASQLVAGRERTAWRILAVACGLWLAGQSVWTYYELFLGGLPSFPHWMQFLFAAYDWFFVAGLLLLPKPPEASPFTPRHGGNLVLIICALIVAFIVALFEPVLAPSRNLSSGLVVLSHCLGLACMFVTALYLLWSYSWRDLYWPLVLIVFGAGTHTVTYIAYSHQMMTKSYAAGEWFNVSWLFVFGAYACAAYERAWRVDAVAVDDRTQALQHERWLEALIPAMLIGVMLSMTWFYSEWLTPRVAGWVTIAALVFAAALGLREIWIQQQEQRLLHALNEINDGMLRANRELSQSEGRYRTLSTELEQRVNERTIELQHAYRELENFSYAVAHDLKSPLRSVDGFGALLAQEYGKSLDEKGLGYLNRMRRSALKMSELIDDLLAYSSVERREFQLAPVPISEIVERVLAEQRDDLERHNMQVELQLRPLRVRADPDGLLLALRNLVQNAIKFSQSSRPPKVAIRVSEESNGIDIAICDNGIGFDMSHHEKIFEMFQRLHRADEIPGTGIGLAIVRKAIERMGGKVWAESQPGQGATFHVCLPSANA